MIYLILIYVCVIISVMLIARSFLEPHFERRMVSARLPTGAPKEAKKAKLRLIFKPLFLVSNFILVQLRLEESLKRKLAGARVKLEPSEFFAIKLLAIAALFILVYLIFGKIDLLEGFGSFFLGFILPDLWLKRKAAGRKVEIVRILPETIDLIGLCIEAGLDFTMAVKWVVDKARMNPLLEELSFVLEEIKWGKPRTQALKDMSKQLNIPDVSSFVQFIVQSERMGTTIAEAFTILSEDTRTQRVEKGERMALKAPIKILIPLLFFILPVIGIIIMGPVFLRFLGGQSVMQF